MMLLGLLLVACHHPVVDAVAVREANLRFPLSDRLALPLDQERRGQILAFLLAGGNTDALDRGDIVDPGADAAYGPFLDLLMSSANLDVEDLENGTFRGWFIDGPVRQVIDARSSRSPATDPYAMRDATYWWIFYPDNGKLGGLLITADYTRILEHYPKAVK